MGTEKRGRPRNDERANFMKWLYDYGYSTQQIGDHFECSRENVRRIFKLRGWKLRQLRK